ncbi:protein kinase domain-containing protein [Sinomonas cellulolyticus]|uniref:Protein kinase domain-containing protein n=1 Tax=Sinomonas cellulolyticus TaxID=2801916 RepID=A0ABS1K0G8_9MICC|nr:MULTISPECIES: hypothetical protein [Sinomonas]MBL0705110.1 hypothetical protein [Sinomonas cellulolyticus]
MKVAAYGYALYTVLHPDGTLTERAIDRWQETWTGRWTRTDDHLEIVVGPYRLDVPVGSHRGLEFRSDSPTSQPQPFAVFPVVEPDQPVPSGQRIAVVKFPGGNAAVIGELQPHGVLREYDLLAGWSEGDWHGEWFWRDSRLRIDVGQYGWVESTQLAPGYRVGSELHEATTTVFPVVSVSVAPAQTYLSAGQIGGEEAAPIFAFEGYEFFSPLGRSQGYFASVLQARRKSITGRTRIFAAKCIRGTRNAGVARREIAISEEVSATDGLIAAFESFQLPEQPEFGEFRGAVVHLLEWGDTDLARYISASGPMDPTTILTVIRDVAAALQALHFKFGLVHADVRPANVIGRRTGNRLSWRLADFNVTSRIDPCTQEAPYLGTSEVCVSPEMEARRTSVANGSTVRTADDIWALGLLVIQCALGSVWDSSRSIDSGRAEELLGSVPHDVRDLAAGALSRESSGRWTAAKVYAIAVERLHNMDLS